MNKLDYESLYREYLEKYNCMCERCRTLESKFNEEHEKKMILEGQMEIVKLIFGGVDHA